MIGEIDRVDHVTVRIVVRDAGEAIDEIGSCMDALGLEVVEATEHVVDYDEAFVRVVERHRASTVDESRHVGSIVVTVHQDRRPGPRSRTTGARFATCRRRPA